MFKNIYSVRSVGVPLGLSDVVVLDYVTYDKRFGAFPALSFRGKGLQALRDSKDGPHVVLGFLTEEAVEKVEILLNVVKQRLRFIKRIGGFVKYDDLEWIVEEDYDF